MSDLDESVLARLKEDIGGDEAILRDLVETFESEGRKLLADLRAGVAQLDVFHRAAHTLKSTSATMGAPRLSGLAKQLEAEARMGRVENPGPRVEALATEFDRTVVQLRAFVGGLK